MSLQQSRPRLSSAELLQAIETESDYDRPLAVQIAALLYVAGVMQRTAARAWRACSIGFSAWKYHHWDKTLSIAGQTNWQAAIKNGVAQVTLVGHVDGAAAAEALIDRDPLFHNATDIDVHRVRRALSLIFPGEDDGLVGLEPDLIGEHHVTDVITDTLVDACLDWAGDDRERRQHILTVLNRATRAEHGVNANRAAAQLARLVRTQAAALGGDLVKVAFETPGRLLDLCPALETQLDGLDDSELAAIDAELPIQSLTLMVLSLSVASRRADLARELDATGEAADVPPNMREKILGHLAARLGTLGIRLSNLGHREEALAASQEAVDIRRRLAQTRPDALAHLTNSLNNLGIRFANLGRAEEALAAGQEALDIYRRLAQTRPDTFLPHLAASLTNLGAHFSKLGRSEEALATTQEGVDIRRQLVQARPEAYLPDLAKSLNNLGRDLYDVGRREDALAAIQEAVNIRRHLAQTRPDAFLPDLARSLNNLGVQLFNLGRHEEALTASQQAVDIRRPLARARPDAFLPDLATSISVMSDVLAALGRHEEAAQASVQALELLAPFVERYPQTYEGLARTICADIVRYSEAAGQTPNIALLARIERALGNDEAIEARTD